MIEQLSHVDLQTPLDQVKIHESADETAERDVDVRDARMTPEPIPVHPLAEIFPVLEGPEFDALVSDVAKHGQLEPIVLFEDKILDGRNRYRACVAADVVPRFEPYQGDDPLGLVVSRNVRRRHLDESQRALVAAKLATMSHGGNRKAGQDANLRVDRSEAAKMLNVSERSVASAAKVLGKGEADLIHAVEQAKLKVSAAAKATELSAKLQRQVAKKALAGDAKAARTIIAQKQTAAPGKKYGVVVIDLESLQVVQHRLASVAGADCVLFISATPPRLAQALDAMKGSGFKYRSHCILAKDHIGTDHWFRIKHEILIVGVRGEVTAPELETPWPSLIEASVDEHSAEPEIFLQMIEEYFPTRSKIHLNRRGRPRAGWDDGADAEAEADEREA